MITVLQEWTKQITLKQQTVLIEAIRGPDCPYFPNSSLKNLIRWIRNTVLVNADPDHSFMKVNLPNTEALEKEFEFCTVHYVSHLLYSLEVITYCHNDPEISKIAGNYYSYFVEDFFHLRIETKDMFTLRLRDKIKKK